MFSKSSLFAIAFAVAAIASATTSASALSSRPYAFQEVNQLAPPQRELPAAYQGLTTVGRSEYPMPRRPMRQPFN